MNTPANTTASHLLLITALEELRQDFETHLKKLNEKRERQSREMEELGQELRREVERLKRSEREAEWRRVG
jgi:predicted component of type VI protein secretion system